MYISAHDWSTPFSTMRRRRWKSGNGRRAAGLPRDRRRVRSMQVDGSRAHVVAVGPVEDGLQGSPLRRDLRRVAVEDIDPAGERERDLTVGGDRDELDVLACWPRDGGGDAQAAR